ncbi:kynurenine formamidase [Ruminiclostridium hungatei]|uniref:Kynurenine formamidase n=1 Tax=Ruminiclostridium hungatei TaxID=48256 RepID=A0A1V4SDQ7_RUMHU|nr:cyclase family protein [Ruminiclostridium hungatei]OPX41990.1 kynurenine formamidase [Ruminiclostridium hungatei]
MKIIDLSQPIHTGMPVYPGDDSVILEHTSVYKEAHYNNHLLHTGMHAGTHIDGKMHLLDVSEYISSMPLEHFCGTGGIIHAQNEAAIALTPAYAQAIKGKSIVLIHTGMDKYYGTDSYYTGHPVLDMSLCRYLADNNIRLLGIDMPSPDRFPFEIHKFLLKNNILILENLTNLDKLNQEDEFEVMAFPLKINADSSMVRAVARLTV